MWQFIKNRLFMIKRAGLLYNWKPRNVFLFTLILGSTGIPRILNTNFISGGLLLVLFIFGPTDWNTGILLWIGLFDAFISLFYREPEQKKKAEEDKHKVTRAAVTTNNTNEEKEDEDKHKITRAKSTKSSTEGKPTPNMTRKKQTKIGNKICHFCGAPIPSNETVCSYCGMEISQ